jgi:predicted DNA-binding transcriptional regulator AlpA
MSAVVPGWAHREIVDLADARPGRVGNSEAVFDVFTRRRQRYSATRPAGVPTVASPVGANEPLSKVAEHGTPELPCDSDLIETSDSAHSRGNRRSRSLAPMGARGALDTLEAAEYIGVARATLKKWRATGDGPPFVRMGCKVVYRPADLDQYLADRVVGGSR